MCCELVSKLFVKCFQRWLLNAFKGGKKREEKSLKKEGKRGALKKGEKLNFFRDGS